jgi:hypothetical protein
VLELTLAPVATLNYKWAKTDRLRSFEDKVALYAIAATGTVVGWTYYEVEMYLALNACGMCRSWVLLRCCDLYDRKIAVEVFELLRLTTNEIIYYA